ncbi:hypothetical protein [Mesorhizobium sp. CAU 1741]|uniref:hypothetical protein n=1 Tax=Mesorhizobium sp. CAU 1741 TaxID=3140366 RepID=UPI00325BE488
MTKTDKQDLQKSIEKAVDNTSGGGHLGGTHFGQSADAKTTSTVTDKGSKARPNNGRN